MAFNFNWSPLIADTDRVREMLTSSLNKSPKPPIIVDDIIVNELNLGSTPPELEILEIGDLAEDRFRGIFKMSYTGDAYLTLKTRVQVNPLKTYLSTKPSFASITLVFRNDPLESLKVSSTFDSIPFVRDYLQKTIENQLRVLFMEDLPAIIHKLSLRLFSPDYQTAEEQVPKNEKLEGRAMDPFASPAQQPVDDDGLPVEGIAPFALDSPNETYASFSQKNLLRLAALTESQRTLSLFTPSIRDTVYRAWASAVDRNDLGSGVATPVYRPATLSRIQSTLGSAAGHTVSLPSAPSHSSEAPSAATRPSLHSLASAPTIYSLGTNTSRPRTNRKRKNRIVNLRKDKDEKDGSDAASVSSGFSGSAGRSESISGPSVSGTNPTSLPGSALREGEISTPPRSPQKKKVGFQQAEQTDNLDGKATIRKRPTTPLTRSTTQLPNDLDQTPRASMILPEKKQSERRPGLPKMQTLPSFQPPNLPRSASDLSLRNLAPALEQAAPGYSSEGSTGGILEQAWMLKMANEIAARAEKEKRKKKGSTEVQVFADRGDAPPAYVS
ncbi:hypothetical protein EJ03DRAFT_310289 [Teratosphaeria nubilosa]|uniref:SMP-LTD domain-containing protein n=1 Tax=Teratosphaeria nubilosa TaxID=161662 RepID=A0A6G1LCV7_9PEZI|nr:hypothetical protein EJ03DRAFT_310289 [Teratosphaeria nubilosa]